MIYVGIDVAAESFAVTVFFGPERYKTSPDVFPNTEAGVKALLAWLHAQGTR